jgi:hypothetical protein
VPNDLELSRLETEVKAAKRGLWSVLGARAPWSWRKGDGMDATAGFIGNRKSLVYHQLNCRGVAKMNEANKVTFATAEKAEATGYRRTGDCR